MVSDLRPLPTRGFECIAEHGDNPAEPIPVTIEIGRGLLLACLRATGRKVFAINPLSVARYRERHTVARSKSDHADAMTLANILRMGRRPAPGPCPMTLSWSKRDRGLGPRPAGGGLERQQLANQLRSLLLEYFPAALKAFQVNGIGLTSRETRAVLAAAPTPTAAAKLGAFTASSGTSHPPSTKRYTR